MTRAIVFDLDGTLFDTREDLAETVNRTREDFGLARQSVAWAVGFVGQGAKYLLSHTVCDEIKDRVVGIDEVWPVFSRHYAETCCDKLQPYAGVPETLEELRRRGFALGVNTNKPNFAVREIFRKFGFDKLFGEAIIAGGDCAALKPSVESMNALASRMNRAFTSEDWMVGDSWTDLKCAANAGVKGAFCAFGFGQLADAPYDLWLDRFDKLQDLIRE